MSDRRRQRQHRSSVSSFFYEQIGRAVVRAAWGRFDRYMKIAGYLTAAVLLAAAIAAVAKFFLGVRDPDADVHSPTTRA